MPRGPNGERRPGDVVGCAVTVAKDRHGWSLRRNYRRTGKIRSTAGKARADSMTPEERSELAKTAARARWGNTAV